MTTQPESSAHESGGFRPPRAAARRGRGRVMAAAALCLALGAPGIPPAARAWPQVAAADLPYELPLLGQIGSPATALAGSGDVLYAALGDQVAAIDVSDPAAPRLLARSAQLAAPPLRLALADGTLAAALGGAGLCLLDVRDPAAMRVGPVLRTAGAVVDVAAAGHWLVAADERDGLLIVDGRDVERPAVRARLASPRGARAVAVAGNTAYVGERDPFEQLVRVVDLSDPTAPTQISFVDVPGMGDALAATERAVYVLMEATGAANRVRVIDVADRQRPRVVAAAGGAVPQPVGAVRPGLPGLAGPQQAPGPAAPLPGNWAAGRALALDGGRLFVGFGTSVTALALDAPLRPQALGVFQAPAAARSLAGRAPHAFVAAGPAGVLGVDFRPTPPRQVGTLAEGAVGQPAALLASGERLFVADALGAVRVVDVAEPARPRVTAVWATRSVPTDLALSGDYLVIAQGLSVVRVGNTARYEGGLEIVYLGRPGELVHAADADTACDVRALAVEGRWAYAAERTCLGTHQAPGRRGLTVFDLSNPIWPAEVGSAILTVAAPSGIAARGTNAYLADAGAGTVPGTLWTLTAAEGAPEALGSLRLAGPARAVALSGRYALVAAGASGLMAIDVSDPGQPRLASVLQLQGEASSVAVEGEVAYVAAGEGGLAAVDVSDPESPRLLASTGVPGSADVVAIDAGRVYVGVRDGLVQVRALRARATATATATPTAGASPTATGTAVPPTPARAPDGSRSFLPVALAARP